jgi:hypothetical protein
VSDSQTALQIGAVKDGPQPVAAGSIADQYPRTWQEADESILSLFDDEILEQASLILLGKLRSGKTPAHPGTNQRPAYRFFGYASSLPSCRITPCFRAWQKLIAENTAIQHRSITLTKVDGRWLYYEASGRSCPNSR